MRINSVRVQEKEKFSSRLSNSFTPLRLYLDFLFYLGFSPYHFRKGIDGQFYFYTSPWRKVSSIVVQGLSVFTGITFTRQYMEGTNGLPDSLFTFFTIATTCVFPFILIYILWAKQGVLCEFVTLVQLPVPGSLERKSSGRYWGTFATVLCCCLVTITVLFYENNVFAMIFAGRNDWAEVMRGHFEYAIYLKNNSDPSPDSYSSEPISFIVSIFSLIYYIMSHYMYLTVAGLDMVVTVVILTVRKISIEFQTYLESGERIGMVMDRYEAVAKMVDMVNDIGGLAVVASCLSLVPVYSSEIVEAILTADLSRQLLILVFVISSLVPFIVAAETSERFDKFRAWLLREGCMELDNPPWQERRMVMAFVRLSNEPMGVRGCSIFGITYRFLGTALSILISYSVLAYQLRGKS